MDQLGQMEQQVGLAVVWGAALAAAWGMELVASSARSLEEPWSHSPYP